MTTDPAPDQTASNGCKDKSVDRFLLLWTHQNNLLWGRLQTVSVLQAAVFAGWYATFIKGDRFVGDFLGAMVALLGLYLTCKLKMLIESDIEFRDEQKRKIKKLEKGIFPEPDGKGGDTITQVVRVFIYIAAILLIISTGKIVFCLIYWIGCGCSCWG